MQIDETAQPLYCNFNPSGISRTEQVLAEFEERGKLSEEKKRLLAYVDGLQNILKRNPYLNAGVGCGYQDFKDFACGRQFL